MRVGWLELAGDDAKAPPELETAARLGALRAVSIGPSRAVAVKSLLGEPVLSDVLREHFAGCILVLVRGEISAPLLEPADSEWLLRDDGGSRRVSTAELVSRLRRPRLA